MPHSIIKKDLLLWFVRLELGIALVGGISSVVIFATSAMLPTIFTPIFYSFCIGIGAMVGAEIPLLIRLMKQDDGVEKALSNVWHSIMLGHCLAHCYFRLWYCLGLGFPEPQWCLVC